VTGGSPAPAIRDQLPGPSCSGCGADNPDGLHLRSNWDGALSRARFRPSAAFAAGPPHVVNGGLIATLLDRHVELEGCVREVDGDATTLECVLRGAGNEGAPATVRSVRVPEPWRHGAR
jgi:hypothetical protein